MGCRYAKGLTCDKHARHLPDRVSAQSRTAKGQGSRAEQCENVGAGQVQLENGLRHTYTGRAGWKQAEAPRQLPRRNPETVVLNLLEKMAGSVYGGDIQLSLPTV